MSTPKMRRKMSRVERDFWLVFGWVMLKPGEPFPEDRYVALREMLAVIGQEDFLYEFGVGPKGE